MSSEEYIELEDGSVEIPDEEPEVVETEFLSNLANVLEADDVKELASELVELVEKDKESRKKRDKQYEEGLRRTGLGDDAPGGAEFDGASKVVHPILAEACVDFSARAIKELFPATGPVRRQQFQDVVSPQVLQAADKKVEYMNWQLTVQMPEYRPTLEQLLTQLPMGGSQYQKFWYDERFKRPRVEFVPVDELLLPFSSTSFYTAPRVTHRQLINKMEFNERVKSGLYRDVFAPIPGSTPERSNTSTANDKIEGREDDGYNEDGLRAILEIYTWQVIEDDEVSGGEYAPYIITIDEDTEECLAIYRNWAEGDPTLAKLDWIVEWVFIPWRGAYGIGLPHLIGGLSAALTGALRAVLDSAHINNAATMLKLKSGRIVGQNTEVSVTQVCDIEAPAGVDDIRKIAMAMPFNPPSPVLVQLMGDLYGLAKGVVATADEKMAQVGDRTPVGTTMALIEQGSTTYSAIHSRLHESQKKALAILHRINATFLPPPDPQNPDPTAVSSADFNGSVDVIPVSDPTIFSEAQRFAQTQAILQMSQDQAVQWNKYAMYRRALKQMRVDNPDELLPPPKSPVTADAATENAAVITGQQIQANPQQDHMGHIQGHMAFLMSPLQLQNPLVPAPALMGLINHVSQHIQMMEQNMTMQTAQVMMQQAQAEFITQQQIYPASVEESVDRGYPPPSLPQPASPDQVMAQAIAMTQQQLTQMLGPIVQALGQAQAELQKRMPQPPMPPEVQATLQIAQAETQRKATYDQGMLKLRETELQADQQTSSAELQLEAQAQQFNQFMERLGTQFDQFLQMQKLSASTHETNRSHSLQQENTQLTQQVELMKNREDNEQKASTEILKNVQDNLTKERIAAGQLQVDANGQAMESLNEQLRIEADNASAEAIAEMQTLYGQSKE